MAPLRGALGLYLKGATLFGLVHAIPYAWSHQSSIYPTHGRRELLVVDKVALIGFYALSAPVVWPLMLREDLVRLECLVRGKSVREYLPVNDDD